MVRVCGDARRGVLIKDDGFELGTGIRLFEGEVGPVLDRAMVILSRAWRLTASGVRSSSSASLS